MKLSVHLVTWNGAKYVPYLFDSLRKQTCQDWELVILDNASEDGMVEVMREELVDFPVPHTMIISEKNTGFAGGHNRLFQETTAPFFLLLNQDLTLEPECLERLMDFIEPREQVGSIAPRLMRWDFARGIDGGYEQTFTHYIDSLGLEVFRNRRVVEKYNQENWDQLKEALPDDALEVFGVSGTMPLFRRSVLEKIAFSDRTIFDPAYHAYKEDVDLAFRLRSTGFASYIVLDAVAYHDRSAAGPRELRDRDAVENKKKQSEWVRYHSYKNHLMTLYKNEYWQNAFLDFPWILWYEWKKFIWFLLFDPKVIGGLKEVWRLRKEIRKRKSEIKARRHLTWKEMRKWFGH